jgi:hypothetical protein
MKMSKVKISLSRPFKNCADEAIYTYFKRHECFSEMHFFLRLHELKTREISLPLPPPPPTFFPDFQYIGELISRVWVYTTIVEGGVPHTLQYITEC